MGFPRLWFRIKIFTLPGLRIFAMGFFSCTRIRVYRQLDDEILSAQLTTRIFPRFVGKRNAKIS